MFHTFTQGDSARLQYVGGHSWNFNFNVCPSKEVIYDTGFSGDSICYSDTLGINKTFMDNNSFSQVQDYIRDIFNDQTINLVRVESHKNFVWDNIVYSFILSSINLEVSNF